MPYPADFVDAHARHWDDAQILFRHERWASADQLYGFSVECGLKAVMQHLGMPVDETGKPVEREHQEHVPRIWQAFTAFAAGRGGERYLGLLPAGEPFEHWSHHDRYAHRQHFERDGVARHRAAALRIRDLVQSMVEDRGGD